MEILLAEGIYLQVKEMEDHHYLQAKVLPERDSKSKPTNHLIHLP